MNTFKALDYDGTISTVLLKDKTIQRRYTVRVGLEVFEYADTIGKDDVKKATGRVGELRHRAVVRWIENAMRRRGIKPKPIKL